MKKKVENAYSKRITIRLREDEYKKLLGFSKGSLSVGLSDYVRKRLLDKPIVYTVRNQSTDDMVAELLLIKKYLSNVANNVNQAVKKMHGAKLTEDFQAAVISLRLEQGPLQKELVKLDLFMRKISDDGSKN